MNDIKTYSNKGQANNMSNGRDKNELFESLKLSLQAFQSTRLGSVYEDLKLNPEYKSIANFFFNKLYAPEDFTFRDTSIKKLNNALDGKVYQGMVKGVTRVIELHELSDKLDDLMVYKMIESGIDNDMTMEEYQYIYKSLDNYDQRLYQINLIGEVTRTFHKLSQKWIVGISLKTVKVAAMMFSIKPVIDFVYDGYTSFKTIKNIDYFADTILEREIAWHNEIWSKNIT
ncbi:hypothetical protein KAJ27_09655 [bacterium]|nr:hypothetical protein [bacterium]